MPVATLGVEIFAHSDVITSILTGDKRGGSMNDLGIKKKWDLAIYNVIKKLITARVNTHKARTELS